jgi:chaperonin GroES
MSQSCLTRNLLALEKVLHSEHENVKDIGTIDLRDSKTSPYKAYQQNLLQCFQNLIFCGVVFMTKKANKIRPLSDRVVVQAQEAETKTAGGIYIPDTADKDKPVQGVIIAVGNGKFVDGKLQPLQVKPGDKVLFGKYSGTAVKLEDTEYLVMREEDIMGVLEEA